MRVLVVLCCIAVAAAKPRGFQVLHASPAAVLSSPVSVSSQYHAQDALGQYSYGYSAGTSAKAESKTYDGVTRGGYSYLDANGVVQSANYVADDATGFHVASTNIVQDTPDVVAAKAAHATAYNQAAYAAAVAPDVSETYVVSAPAVKSYVSPVVASVPAVSDSVVVAAPSVKSIVSPIISAPAVKSYVAPVVKDVFSKAFSYSTVAASPVVSHVVAAPAITSYSIQTPVHTVPLTTFEHKAPVITSYNVHQTPSVAVAAAPITVEHKEHTGPVAYSAPVSVGVAGTTSHQYHVQDTLGQYTYGYSGGPVAKAESKTADGVVRGGYSYVDGNGLVQSASYVADDTHGFRVAGTNIPVDNTAHVVADTPAVVVAKVSHDYDY